ncbi:MAG: DUF167 domain-containing protein, partial [Actinobacteria bacterium]|nr:DUF167 domain-containing protein [Actinomycetota bacterium]
MDVDDLYSTSGDDAVILHVHLHPGAGRSAVVGRHGDALKLKVAAPPQGGRANEACAALVADIFGTPAAAVELVSGPVHAGKAGGGIIHFSLLAVAPVGMHPVVSGRVCRSLTDRRSGALSPIASR